MFSHAECRAHEANLREQVAAARVAAASFEAQRDALRDALVIERERCDQLVEQLLQLRREGFQPAPPPVDTAKAPESYPPAVRSAMLDLANPGTEFWYRLGTEAEALLAQDGATAESVAKQLAKSGSYNPWSEG